MPAPYSPFLLDLGFFQLRWYSLLIVVGIALAIWLSKREFVRRGYPSEWVDDFAYAAVPLAIIGARLYHVFTTLEVYLADPLAAFQIWRGGLGIYGAVIGGFIGVVIVARLKRMPFQVTTDSVAPGLILAQAVGRWGNYFNQEIFGPPTDLPWGLFVDPPYRPAAYAAFEHFHPTFLYESLWNLVIGLLLLRLSRRFWPTWWPGTLSLLYVALYSLGRFLLENLKVDDVLMIGPFRFNLFVSGGAAIVFGLWFLLWLRRANHRPYPVGPLLTETPTPAPTATPTGVTPPAEADG